MALRLLSARAMGTQHGLVLLVYMNHQLMIVTTC